MRTWSRCVSGHRASGRRDRPRAVACRPHAGRGAADPPRFPARRLLAREPPGAARRRSTTRPSRRSWRRGRAEAPDGHGRGEPQPGPPPPARPVGDPPAGLHDPRRADELPPRARPGHRADRDRRDLRRPRPDDRRGRRRQPADRRAAAGPRGRALRLRPRPADRKRVTTASKYTIQKATDGLFESVAKEVAGAVPRGAAQRRAVRRPARQGDHDAREVPDRARAERVRRLPLGHGLRPGRLARHRRQRQPRVRPGGASSASRFTTPRTAPRPTSPARTWPTRRRSSSPSSMLLYQIGEISCRPGGQERDARPAPPRGCGPATSAARSRPSRSPRRVAAEVGVWRLAVVETIGRVEGRV